jgi:uncharacterized repeat protein (TIGR01451 family)
VASVFLLAACLTLLSVHQVTHAQSGQILLTKVLNRDSNVVRVGEVLSFTIALTNTSGFTLTKVTLVDVYSHTILGFSRAVPPPDRVNPDTGVLTWTNVASPEIGLNRSLTFTLFFTAEHPRTAVINFVRAQDITGTGQSLASSAETSRTDRVIGGAAPVYKSLSPDSIPQVGAVLTFTHLITNDGAALLTRLPLTDTYNPDFLQFHFALPTPTITTPAGLLVWTDLTSYFGDIPPFYTVVVTTVFTATNWVVNTTVNSASVQGALDEYNNDLAANVAQVPITIIDTQPAPAATPEDDDDNIVIPAPTPTVTPTPVVTKSAALQAPLYLPETGWLTLYRIALPVLGLFLAIVGWMLVKRYNH